MSTRPESAASNLDEIKPALPELPEFISNEPSPLAPEEHPNIPVDILSAQEGHDYFAVPAVRAKAALTNTGILYLAEGAQSDVLVRSYIAALDRRRRLSDGKIVPYTQICTVPYTEIQRLYTEASDGQVGANASARSTAEQSQVSSMVAEAAQAQASDIFIEVYETSAEIQYRIAGDIERRFAMKPEETRKLIRTIYDSMGEATDPYYDPSRDQGGRIAKRFTEGLGLHQIRVSTGPTDEERPFMTLRLHYDLGEPRSLVELGFTQAHHDALDAVTGFSSGIILFSGPTGSGKSTSLANLIGYRQKLDNCRRKVIALEDPPEIPIFGAVQKAVLRKGLGREEEGQGWISGFETLMRWNPDWIIAGELRLRETMDAALKSALTNHLTWGMLHASSASHVPVRLQEAGIELGYLSDPGIFRLFINQSLVPQLCPHCSQRYAQARPHVSPELARRIEKHCTPDTVRVRGDGCEQCYRGVQRKRTICAEVLSTDHRLLSIFRSQGALALRRHWVREYGGKTKVAHVIDKINAGQIDPADAERIVDPLDTDDHLWENNT